MEFFNPEAPAWHHIDLLEKSTEEIQALFPNRPDGADFVLETKHKRNPIMFCSRRCEGKWMGELLCSRCGGIERTTEEWYWPSNGSGGLSRGIEVRPVTLKSACASCSGLMLRRMDLLYTDNCRKYRKEDSLVGAHKS